MQITLPAIISLLAATISAAPTTTPSNPVTVSLSNDLTGANAAATVSADGISRSIVDLFGKSAVAVNGEVLASSAQLTQFPQDVFCNIVLNGNTLASLSTDKTFADLDGNANKAVPLDLNGAVLICEL